MKIGDSVSIVVRPEDVSLVSGSEADRENVVEGEIALVLFLGEGLGCQVALGGTMVRLKLHPSASIQEGQRVTLAIASEFSRALMA